MSLALQTNALISPAYLATQRALHGAPKGYGRKGDRWASAVSLIARHYDCWSVLDYGCGQGTLAKALRTDARLAVREYDPAITGKHQLPAFADLVICTDVLEHVEPDRLDTVLAHLQALTRKALFLVVSTRPASKTLMDGRNAHLIIESGDWWRQRVLASGFEIQPTPSLDHAKPPKHAWIAVGTPS